MINLATIRGGTRAEGPGLRVAVWTQGCSIKCKGCFNPELWGLQGGEQVSTSELTQRILAEAATYPGTEGVTFMGGEPFDQPGELAIVASNLRDAGLSVMVFTGFTLEELRESQDASNSEFLREIDLLVDGKFEKEKVDNERPWLGSSNQRFHFLSSRYNDTDLENRDYLELTVKASGELILNGWANPADLEQVLKILDEGLSSKPQTH